MTNPSANPSANPFATGDDEAVPAAPVAANPPATDSSGPQNPGVQATTSSASLLEQMDREQDGVLRDLDDLNQQIEALIHQYARSRRSDDQPPDQHDDAGSDNDSTVAPPQAA